MKRLIAWGVWPAIALGLVARLVFGLGYWVDKPLTHDEREYLLLARNVAAGRGFQYLGADGLQTPGEHFGRAPLYPLLLAAIIQTTGEGMAGSEGFRSDAPEAVPTTLLAKIKIVQSFAGAAVVWIIAWLAGRAAGRGAAVMAAWLAALYPPLVWLPAYVFSETLYSLLALICIAILGTVLSTTRATVRDTGTWSAARVAASGVVAGLAVLTRPVMLFFLLLAAPWLWWKRELAMAVLLVVGSVVAIAPWTIRNAQEYGRFVLVASEGGITFWTGNHPLAIGEGDMAANPEIKRTNVDFRARHQGLNPEQLEPLYYQDALAWIAANPGAEAWLIVRKAFYTVAPIGPSYRLHSPLYFWASVVPYLSILPFALMGLAAGVRRVPAVQPLLALAISSLAVGLVFFPQERFRIPVIDPTLIVCAASWWALKWESTAPMTGEVRA